MRLRITVISLVWGSDALWRHAAACHLDTGLDVGMSDTWSSLTKELPLS